MKRKLAERLRALADWLDGDTGYRYSFYTFRIIRGKGAVVEQFKSGVPDDIDSGKYGTPLFYRAIDYKGIEDA